MFGKFCLRVTVGIGVYLLFGGKDAIGVLVMSVVCTAGLGLIVVLPAAYLIGLVCTIWFIPFGNRAGRAEEKLNQGRNYEPTMESGKSRSLAELNSLRSFIEAADAKGRDWNSIRNELIDAGWDSKTIERVREHAGIVSGVGR